MHSCSLMQASTQMPTRSVVAADERCWLAPLDGRQCGAFKMQPRRLDVSESHRFNGSRVLRDNGRGASSPPGGSGGALASTA